MTEINTSDAKAFVPYCKMCQKLLSSHDDEDLNRCLKIRELTFWKKE